MLNLFPSLGDPRWKFTTPFQAPLLSRLSLFADLPTPKLNGASWKQAEEGLNTR